jgi:hypothetical protein
MDFVFGGLRDIRPAASAVGKRRDLEMGKKVSAELVGERGNAFYIRFMCGY